jgi:hypothetical protein
MSSFSAFHVPGETMHLANMATLARFREIGITHREGFYATGMPLVQYVDRTQSEGKRVDLAYFSRRLRLGNGLLSSRMSPFHADGMHITLVKWGPGEDDCGRVDAHESVCLSECTIVSYCSVTIEEGVLFGPTVYMFDCDQSPADPEGPRNDPANMEMAPIVIEHHAWIGSGAIIMPGVRIGHHETVSANAIVTKDVEPHTLVAGNPGIVAARFA